MKLDEEVFTQKAFQDYANQNFILVKIDFPKKMNLSPTLKQENDELARRYDIKGFPTIVIVDRFGQEVTRLGYTEGGPSAFIERLETQLKTTSNADQAPARSSKGTIVMEGYDDPPPTE